MWVSRSEVEVEEKFLSLLMHELHLYLLMGIVAFIYLLKSIGPIRRIIWGTAEEPSKWKWLVTPINVALSFIGIFLAGLTPFTTGNMKFVAALIISATATFAYELIIKHFETLIKTKLIKKPAG
jgi:hypothetical protein